MRFLRVKAGFAHEGMGDSRVIGSSERREDLDRGIGKICDWRDSVIDLPANMKEASTLDQWN